MSIPNDIFSIEHRHFLLYKVFQEVKERFGHLRENDKDTYSYTSTTLQKVLCCHSLPTKNILTHVITHFIGEYYHTIFFFIY